MIEVVPYTHARMLDRIVHGVNSLGHDFGHYYPAEKWRLNVEDPLVEFAATVYCKSQY